MDIADWNLCPGELKQLMSKAGRWFGLTYGQDAVHLATFKYDPQQMPVLLFNGGRSIKLDATQQEVLRAFVLSGGMAVFDSIAGGRAECFGNRVFVPTNSGR